MLPYWIDYFIGVLRISNIQLEEDKKEGRGRRVSVESISRSRLRSPFFATLHRSTQKLDVSSTLPHLIRYRPRPPPETETEKFIWKEGRSDLKVEKPADIGYSLKDTSLMKTYLASLHPHNMHAGGDQILGDTSIN